MLLSRISKKKILHNFVIFLFILLFVFLSTKYKIQSEAAIRPLYSLGLLCSIIFFSWYLFRSSVSQKLAVSMLLQPQILLFSILLTYILASSIFIYTFQPVRQLQDTLYFISWITIIPLISFYLVSNKIDLKEVFIILSKSIIYYAILATILALIVIFNYDFEIGPVLISQSPYLPFRIHGSLGEPTALAALLGTALIAIYYLKNETEKKYRFTMFLLLFGIFAAGSRNGIVSIMAAFFMSIFFETIKVKKIVIFFLIMIFIIALSAGIIYALNLDEIIYKIFFNRPDFDANHRFSRIYTWTYTINEIFNGSIFQFFFGNGAYELRRSFGAAYNSAFEIAHDFGIFMFLIFISLFLLSIQAGYTKYKKSGIHAYKFACMLIVYGFSFNMFMSYFPTFWFNFATWSLVIGIWITAVPTKMMIKLKK